MTVVIFKHEKFQVTFVFPYRNSINVYLKFVPKERTYNDCLRVLVKSNHFPTYLSGSQINQQGKSTSTSQETAILNCLSYHAHKDSWFVELDSPF